MADTWTDEELGTSPAGDEAEPEAPTWWAAATTVDITPTWPLPLAGFADRTEPYTSIRSRLEANILLLRPFDDREASISLISVDLLYAGDVTGRVQAWAAERNIVAHLAASHTHYAPATDSTKPLLGKVDPAYVDLVVNAITGGLEQLLTGEPPAEPCMVSHVHTTAPYGVRRRKKGMKLVRSGRLVRLHRGVQNAPDLRSPPVGSLDAVTITASNRIVACIWTAACHPTAAPYKSMLDADYAAAVRARLRQHLGAAPIVFLQGPAGDIRPIVAVPTGTRRVLALAAEKLYGRPPWIVPSPEAWEAWAASMAMRLTEALGLGDPWPLSVTATQTRRPVSGTWKEDGSAIVSNVAVLDFHGVVLVCVNAELMYEHLAWASRACGSRPILLAGCVNDVFGYWPTSAMQRDGGYEANGHRKAFGLVGPGFNNPDVHYYSTLEAALHSAAEPT